MKLVNFLLSIKRYAAQGKAGSGTTGLHFKAHYYIFVQFRNLSIFFLHNNAGRNSSHIEAVHCYNQVTLKTMVIKVRNLSENIQTSLLYTQDLPFSPQSRDLQKKFHLDIHFKEEKSFPCCFADKSSMSEIPCLISAHNYFLRHLQLRLYSSLHIIKICGMVKESHTRITSYPWRSRTVWLRFLHQQCADMAM